MAQETKINDIKISYCVDQIILIRPLGDDSTSLVKSIIINCDDRSDAETFAENLYRKIIRATDPWAYALAVAKTREDERKNDVSYQAMLRIREKNVADYESKM